MYASLDTFTGDTCIAVRFRRKFGITVNAYNDESGTPHAEVMVAAFNAAEARELAQQAQGALEALTRWAEAQERVPALQEVSP